MGKLTPGIIHKIQNPLNFVNNFSEVSNELVIVSRSRKSACLYYWANDCRRLVRWSHSTTYPGLYFIGDGNLRDEDGYYRITGRVDDVLNVSGHRLGTAEVENAIK